MWMRLIMKPLGSTHHSSLPNYRNSKNLQLLVGTCRNAPGIFILNGEILKVPFWLVTSPMYPPVRVYIIIETHHFLWENQRKMAIFNSYVSYVSLPEGKFPFWLVLYFVYINHYKSKKNTHRESAAWGQPKAFFHPPPITEEHAGHIGKQSEMARWYLRISWLVGGWATVVLGDGWYPLVI